MLLFIIGVVKILLDLNSTLKMNISTNESDQTDGAHERNK